MAKTVTIKAAPDLVAKPIVNFTVEEHRAMVWNKGYNAIIESAVKCPCATHDNSNLSTCQNCLGIGYVMINPVQDRVILSSINYDTKLKDWSEEKLGSISITAARRTYLSYMDRITVVDSSVISSELINPRLYNTDYFGFTIYPILEIVDVFKFINATTKLTKLEEGVDFTFEGNKIIMTSTPAQGYSISVRYKHQLQYHVLDNPHIIRNSYRKDNNGRDELQLMPINAVGRLAHYVIDALNFEGDNILDNSY